MLDNLSKNDLKAITRALMWNEQLGCYTRQAFETVVWREIHAEAQWIAFFDVDEMKKLNDRLGWNGTSELVRRAITDVRSSDYVTGQVLSGDEFVIALTRNNAHSSSHPQALCERIQANLRAGGASATFAYCRATSSDLQENLSRIMTKVMEAKHKNLRGTITFVEA